MGDVYFSIAALCYLDDGNSIFVWFVFFYLGISPLANSRNGILCDFVPPIVTIRMSAAKEPPRPANINNNPKFIFLLKTKIDHAIIGCQHNLINIKFYENLSLLRWQIIVPIYFVELNRFPIFITKNIVDFDVDQKICKFLEHLRI